MEAYKKQQRSRPLPLRLLIGFLRLVYPHRIKGQEHLEGHEDGTIVLVCNHGEIYGPVAAVLFLPCAFRPWVLSRMMNRDEMVEHMYYGTMERQRWLPERWKRPLLRLIAPVLTRIFEGIEGIPVYRSHPRALLQTFRLTLEAMQAGSNILLFPENADEHEANKSGFVRDGVGEFYTGFPMIGAMCWAKARKRCVFVPVYACRRHRVLTIGQGVVYDPTRPVNEEKQRIAREVRQTMLALSEQANAEG